MMYRIVMNGAGDLEAVVAGTVRTAVKNDGEGSCTAAARSDHCFEGCRRAVAYLRAVAVLRGHGKAGLALRSLTPLVTHTHGL